jgi:hypothetical protein
VRDCRVADSSKYYGCSGLTGSVSSGDYEVDVDTIYGYAVPSARGEAALSNVSAITTGKQTITTGGLDVEVTGNVHTYSEEITAATRRAVFTRTLDPIPGDTAMVVFHARIIDRWYTLTEGESSSVGAITVDRSTGSALVSLSALPDAGTYVLWEWASAIHFNDHAGGFMDYQSLPYQFDGIGPSGVLALEDGYQVDLSSVNIMFVLETVAHSGSVIDGGIIIDNVTADHIGYMSKTGQWKLDIPTDCTTNVVIEFQTVQVVDETFSDLVPDVDGVVTFTLASTPDPGSLTAEWCVTKSTAQVSTTTYEQVWTEEVCESL